MELTKGANTGIGAIDDLDGLVLGVSWDSGDLVCDLCALVCGTDRQVVDDEHFVFWANRATPARDVLLRPRAEPAPADADRAQVLVALNDLPLAVDRIVVVLATMVEGASLSALRSLRMRVLDVRSGTEVASYRMGAELGLETCLLVGEVYRHRTGWKVRAVGQGYAEGLAGIARDYGVNIAD